MPDGFSMCSGIKWVCFINYINNIYIYIFDYIYIYIIEVRRVNLICPMVLVYIPTTLDFFFGDFLGIHRRKWRCAGALAHTLVAEALRRTAHRATRALNKRGFLQILQGIRG